MAEGWQPQKEGLLQRGQTGHHLKVPQNQMEFVSTQAEAEDEHTR